MPDWDAVIVGGGPAGLTAGMYLCRGNWRTLLIEKEIVGGYIRNVEFIENYPGFKDGVVGSQLAVEMKNQALKYGLQVQRGEVNGLQGSPSSKYVTCLDGTAYSTATVIIAGGSTPKRLGVPGEEKLMGNGIITCAFCDGGQFADRVMAVVGGGDSGITGALYMANIASRVILIEAMPECTATAILLDRAAANEKIEIRTGTRVASIVGENQVEAIEIIDASGKKETLKVDGILVHVGLDPRTDYLQDIIPLDSGGQVVVNEWMETEAPGIYAAGDIRSGSPGQVSTAVGDGAAAAMAAQKFLQAQS
jgi:thioredoxin reductase (NADPH)